MQNTEKKFKKLLYLLREEDDGSRMLAIGNLEKHCIVQFSVDKENEKYLKDCGDLTIFDYNFEKNEVEHLKQTDFIDKYCDGDGSFGRKVLEMMKIRLASYGKNGCFGGDISEDENTKYSYIKDKLSNTLFIYGLNLDRDKAQRYAEREADDYVKTTMTDNENYFALSGASTTYCAFTKIEKIMTQQEGIDLCKDLVETCKGKNIELKNIKGIEKGLSLYNDYKKGCEEWNKAFEELRKGWKKISFDGTKIKKGYLMTKEEEAEVKRLQDIENKVQPIKYKDSKRSQYIEFISFIEHNLEVAKNYDMIYNQGKMEIEIPSSFVSLGIKVNNETIFTK